MGQTTNLNWFSRRISEASTVWLVPLIILLELVEKHFPWDQCIVYLHIHPAKFNIAREKLPSQKVSSLPTIHFQGLC